MQLNAYEQQLLNGWEEVFKKGQLTLWILLALKDSPKHMVEIKEFILQSTANSLTADDQSMYRALRRYFDVEMVDFTEEPGESGPDRKVYKLTQSGSKVLEVFVRRNVMPIYSNQSIKNIFSSKKESEYGSAEKN